MNAPLNNPSGAGPVDAGPADADGREGTHLRAEAVIAEAAVAAKSHDVRPSVTVVVPAYNEAVIIMNTMTTLAEYLQTLESEFSWELLIVNDGSKDETGSIAELFASTRANVSVLHHKTNFNLGQTLRYGFSACTTDYVVTVDCDLSYSVDHIGRLLRAIRDSRAKVVLASPYAEDGEVANVPFVRKQLSVYANKMLSFSVKGELSTLTGMVRAYDRVFIQGLDLSSRGVDINTEIIYKARILGAKVVEIPARLAWVSEEPGGRVSKLKLGKSVGAYLTSAFLFRPLVSFFLPALVFLLTALTAIGLVIRQAVVRNISIGASFGLSPTTTIIAAICVVLSLQCFSLGLLAEQNRRNFEYLFHLGSASLRANRASSQSH